MRQLRLGLAQLNPTVGDLDGNFERARRAIARARALGVDLLALPEMFITGYQTQDLILKPVFADAAIAAIDALARDCADGPALGIGGPWREAGRLYNGYHVLEGGERRAVVLKHHLPNDGVFDERRVFSAAEVSGPYRVGPLRIGTPICEDSWHPDVCETLAETGLVQPGSLIRWTYRVKLPEARASDRDALAETRASVEPKLREAGFAPPAPRAAGSATLLQLQRAVYRCPYCGSTETRLDNIFGPTPCRSVRYCTSCRQPFEQFKTI